MSTNLTKKEKGFVKDYLETGHGTQSASNNYDVKDAKSAGVIASQNLGKVKIQNAIAEALPDEDLSKAHKELLNQTKTEYFVFPKKMNDEEIVDKVTQAGLTVIVISEGEKGKYAFYSIADANAKKAALEMAYKIKGTYAPEKKLTVNVDIETSTEDLLLAEQLKQLERNQSTETE